MTVDLGSLNGGDEIVLLSFKNALLVNADGEKFVQIAIDTDDAVNLHVGLGKWLASLPPRPPLDTPNAIL